MIINFILVFALTIVMSISRVEVFDFLGEFCWQFDETVVYHVNLSSTFNGIFATAPKPTGPITHEHISGTATLVSCP
jgi:hypothetical protein